MSRVIATDRRMCIACCCAKHKAKKLGGMCDSSYKTVSSVTLNNIDRNVYQYPVRSSSEAILYSVHRMILNEDESRIKEQKPIAGAH